MRGGIVNLMPEFMALLMIWLACRCNTKSQFKKSATEDVHLPNVQETLLSAVGQTLVQPDVLGAKRSIWL
jgi:hypothetical protein